MNDNVRKIFEILGVEPNEKFKVNGYEGCRFVIEDNLAVCKVPYSKDFNYFKWFTYILNNPELIIKLPKEPKKKKLRDLTKEEFLNWKRNNCGNCKNCIFRNVICTCACKYESLWVECKYLYSDAFLNKEIEVEE